jgi:hypothetical protein
LGVRGLFGCIIHTTANSTLCPRQSISMYVTKNLFTPFVRIRIRKPIEMQFLAHLRFREWSFIDAPFGGTDNLTCAFVRLRLFCSQEKVQSFNGFEDFKSYQYSYRQLSYIWPSDHPATGPSFASLLSPSVLLLGRERRRRVHCDNWSYSEERLVWETMELTEGN